MITADPITEVLTGDTAAADSIASSVTSKISDDIAQLKSESFSDFFSDMSQRLINFFIDVAIAIIVFYIGKFIIKRIYKVVATMLVRRKVESSLITFVLSFVKIVLYFILVVTVIGIIGIETSSFLAIFASAGVAIGMALSGTLQNFAGGVLILFLKPYRIGDYIEAQGYEGTVREIQIFHTLITTYDNKAILIPNGGLSTSSINNWSRESHRRVSWDISISYGDNVEDARRAILAMFEKDPRILKGEDGQKGVAEEDIQSVPEDFDDDTTTPAEETAPRRPNLFQRMFKRHKRVHEQIKEWHAKNDERLRSLRPIVAAPPSVVVDALGDSAVVLQVRAWTSVNSYWSVFYDYNERIYAELPLHGIHFPFPQMDVRITQ